MGDYLWLWWLLGGAALATGLGFLADAMFKAAMDRLGWLFGWMAFVCAAAGLIGCIACVNSIAFAAATKAREQVNAGYVEIRDYPGAPARIVKLPPGPLVEWVDEEK